MTTETFKQVPHYPNYEVSTQGRIRNHKRGNLMKGSDNGKGYRFVKMTNSRGRQKHCLIHRVVLSTFLPKEGNFDVNHIDGNKYNNTLGNLEWVTKSENTRHAHSTGLFSSRDKLTAVDVLAMKAEFRSSKCRPIPEIATQYEVLPAAVYKIRAGTLYGYIK